MGRKKKQILLEDSERITVGYASKYHYKVELREKCHALLLNHLGMECIKKCGAIMPPT
jgi:hypothetical protein